MPASRVIASIRSAGCMRGHRPPSNAARAASTALFTSAGPAHAAWPMTASVCGDITEMTASESGAPHFPSMKSWSLSYIKLLGSLGISWPVETSCVATAVDAEDLSGDVPGFLGDKESTCGRNILGLAHPAHGCAVDVVLHGSTEEVPILGAAQHRCVDKPRWHRVDSDPTRTVFEGKRLGQAVHRGLRRHIVGHERLPGVRAGRRDVDDASPSGLDHIGEDGLNGVEYAVQ